MNKDSSDPPSRLQVTDSSADKVPIEVDPPFSEILLASSPGEPDKPVMVGLSPSIVTVTV